MSFNKLTVISSFQILVFFFHELKILLRFNVGYSDNVVFGTWFSDLERDQFMVSRAIVLESLSILIFGIDFSQFLVNHFDLVFNILFCSHLEQSNKMYRVKFCCSFEDSKQIVLCI